MPKRFYNPEEELHKTKHNLPHWHQDRSLCFITFRLADSLPAELLNELKRKKSLWDQAHPKPWDDLTIQKRAQVITQLADDYLDQGHGSCLLKHPTFRTILSQAFHHFNGQRYHLDSYVIMPNHVHLLLQLSPDHPVGKIVQSLKRHSAREINKSQGQEGGLWQKDYYDRLIRNQHHLDRVRTYIRDNPKTLPNNHFTYWSKDQESDFSNR